MRFGWAGFFGNRRLREIERGQADMRETLAALTAQASLMTERISSLATLLERISAMEERSDVDRKTLQKLGDSTFATDTRVEMQGEEMVRLNIVLLRLEGQLNEQATETHKIATGLLERIEQTRPWTTGR